MKKARYSVAVLLCVIATWMSIDNVFSDIEPIQALAEQAACTVKKCADQHGMTRMERNPIGQSFEFTWKDATIAVSCHREYYVAGARKCEKQ